MVKLRKKQAGSLLLLVGKKKKVTDDDDKATEQTPVPRSNQCQSHLLKITSASLPSSRTLPWNSLLWSLKQRPRWLWSLCGSKSKTEGRKLLVADGGVVGTEMTVRSQTDAPYNKDRWWERCPVYNGLLPFQHTPRCVPFAHSLFRGFWLPTHFLFRCQAQSKCSELGCSAGWEHFISVQFFTRFLIH